MQLNFLSEKVAVCGQLAPGDFDEIAAQGFRVYINNRPDGEAWFGQPRHRDLEQAAASAGMVAHFVPFTPQTLTADDVRRFHAAMSQSKAPVLVSCASGFRSVLLWAIASIAVDGMLMDTVLEAAAQAGRPLDQQVPLIERMVAELKA